MRRGKTRRPVPHAAAWGNARRGITRRGSLRKTGKTKKSADIHTGPVHSRMDVRSGLRVSRWGLRIPDSLPACHGHMCVGSGIVARTCRRAMLCTIGKLAKRICQALSDALHRRVAHARRFRAKVIADRHPQPPFRCLRSRPPPPARCISPHKVC
ncbi:hypothetical protein C5615_15120 [Burkholderia cepacia]|uniref:Uncharacterized protein n=1 Tax=Burkholderia cepacia TaxID=292 RepID=A0A2S8ISQ9_BURCE|nr:hypothetical protein C5615_15120 [Burkholderia cepacia]